MKSCIHFFRQAVDLIGWVGVILVIIYILSVIYVFTKKRNQNENTKLMAEVSSWIQKAFPANTKET